MVHYNVEETGKNTKYTDDHVVHKRYLVLQLIFIQSSIFKSNEIWIYAHISLLFLENRVIKCINIHETCTFEYNH